MRQSWLQAVLAACQISLLAACTPGNNEHCFVPNKDINLPQLFSPGNLQPLPASDRQSSGLSSEDFRRLAYGNLTLGLSELPVSTSFPTPYELLLVGPDTVPLAVNKDGQVLMAAARFGLGKIVVLGHEQFLYDSTFNNLLLNAVSWLKPNATSTVGLYSKFTGLASLLQSAAHKTAVSDTWQPTMGVFCMDTSVATQAKELVNFVQSGGSLLIAGDASAWTGKDALTKATGNQIVSVAGVYFTNQAAPVGTTISFTEIPAQQRIYVQNLGDFSDDISALLSGVTTFDTRYYATLLVHGRLAFPILYGKKNIIVAGAYYGLGRVVVLSHENQNKNAAFVSNAIKWLRGNQQGRIAISPSISNRLLVQSTVTSMGLTPVVTSLKNVSNIDVYLTDGYNEAEAELIQTFVAKGGGLLIGAQAWYWSYSNTVNVIENFPMNKITTMFGISVLTSSSSATWTNTDPAFQRATPYDFRRLVSEFAAAKNLTTPEVHLPQFASDSMEILALKKSSNYHLNQLYFILVKALTASSLKPPSPENPVQNYLERAFWSISAYAPSSINIVAVNATATTGKPWRSTGLYAPPGRAVTFTVPKVAVGSNLFIQFGCQSDNLWDSGQYPFLRYPNMIPFTYQIKSETFTLSTKFGGLIYVVVGSPMSLGNLEFVVEHADSAPYFKDGVTDPADWVKTIRFNPAPWAEIEAKNVILTMRSVHVRNITDISFNTATWNKAMDAVAKLGARSFLNPERMVADIQIGFGWLHSGYPVMAYDEVAPGMANATLMMQPGNFWGFFHEFGHNQQQWIWNFPYSGEITNNLWPVYVGEEVFGVNRSVAWGTWLSPEVRRDITLGYLQSTDTLDNVKSVDMYVLCLNMYLYLQEGFGWQPFMDVIAKYQSMLYMDVDDVGRLNLWVKMFSEQVNRNLVPYFKKLRWPVSKEVEDQLSALPIWAENPLDAFP